MKWISIKDRYPENKEQEVIVCLSSGEIRIAYYSRVTGLGQKYPTHFFEGDLYHIDGSEYTASIFNDVEYWMELPKKK